MHMYYNSITLLRCEFLVGGRLIADVCVCFGQMKDLVGLSYIAGIIGKKT